MIGDSRPTTKLAAVPNRYTPRDTRVSRQQTISTDRNIVAYLHKIIDLGVFTDDRILQRPTINARSSTNRDRVLNDHAPQLRYVDNSKRAESGSETRLADNCTGMYAHAITDHCKADTGPGPDEAISANADSRPNHRSRGNKCVPPDANPRADGDSWPKGHTILETRRRMNLPAA